MYVIRFQLYADYATPLKLHDVRLEIFYSAGHADKALIESLWADIVEAGKCNTYTCTKVTYSRCEIIALLIMGKCLSAELQQSDRHSVESQMEIIRRKLVTMGRKFKNSPAFFPVGK